MNAAVSTRVVAVGLVGGLVGAGAGSCATITSSAAARGDDRVQRPRPPRHDRRPCRRLGHAPPHFCSGATVRSQLLARRPPDRLPRLPARHQPGRRDLGHGPRRRARRATSRAITATTGRPHGPPMAGRSRRLDPLGLTRTVDDGIRRLDPRRLSSSPAEYPSWSPDGSRIAFSLVTAGAVQIAIVRRDGQGERP